MPAVSRQLRLMEGRGSAKARRRGFDSSSWPHYIEEVEQWSDTGLTTSSVSTAIMHEEREDEDDPEAA